MKDKDIKILVADDDETIACMSKEILECEGFIVFTALDGVKALEIFRKERPHISIIDIFLGYFPMDGIELMQQIKGIDPKARVIIMTRKSVSETVTRAKEAGAEVYMNKPADMEEWVNTIKKVVETIES